MSANTPRASEGWKVAGLILLTVAIAALSLFLGLGAPILLAIFVLAPSLGVTNGWVIAALALVAAVVWQGVLKLLHKLDDARDQRV